jgi:hypothetical protein
VTPGTPASLEYPWAPDGSEVVSFVFLPGDPPNSEFGPVGLRFGSGFVDATNFDTFMACDPSIAAMSSCNQDDSESSNDSPASCGPPPPLADSPPCWYPRVNFPGTEQQKAQQLASALQGAGDWPHLVAIYDTVDRLSPADSFGYHVIGWAYYQFETNVVTDSAGDIVRIELTGTFHKLFVNASRLSNSGFGGSLNDFGVRAVGLSADLP